MTNKIINRVLEESNYMILYNKTIREVAAYFNVSKSTVHKDLQKRLIEIDVGKYNTIKEILNIHLSQRHIKGGESTKKLFLNRKQNI